MFKKYTSYLTLFSFVFQLIFPVYATLNSVNDARIEEYERVFGPYPIPAARYLQVSENTAAGVMLVARHEGRSLVLMGLRDDCDAWCTMGGGAEQDKHASLLDTARDECAEETAGMYAFHREDLCDSPCHTLIRTGESPSFSTYIKEVPFRSASDIARLVAKAEDSHKREYRRFAWVDVENLVCSGGSTGSGAQASIPGSAVFDSAGVDESPDPVSGDSNPLNKENVVLFESMSDLLAERMIGAHLMHFCAGNNLYPVCTIRRQELAEPDVAKDEDGNPYKTLALRGFHVAWQEGDSRLIGLKKGTGVLEDMGHSFSRNRVLQKSFASTVVDKMRLVRNFQREREALAWVKPAPLPHSESSEEIAVPSFSHSRATPILSSAEVVKEGMLSSSDPVHPTCIVPADLGPECPSIRLLRKTLNHHFIEGNLHENIKNYLLFFKMRGELDYEVEDIAFFARRITTEQKCWEQGQISLYHGASGNIGELYPVFSMIFSMLEGSQEYSPDGREGMKLTHVRGNNVSFGPLMRALKEDSTERLPVEAIQEIFSTCHDYDPQLVETRLCVNWALPAGPGVSLSTSSTPKYFLKAHSVLAASAERICSLAMRLLGVDVSYDSLRSPFLRAYGPDSDTNGVLIQVVLPPEIVTSYAHAAHVLPGDSQKIAKHFADLYTDSTANGQTSGSEPSAHSRKELQLTKTSLVPEAWFYPLPGVMGEHPETRLYRKKEIPHEALAQLYSDLQRTVRHTLVDLVASGHGLIPGAFHGHKKDRGVQQDDPRLLKLARLATEIVYGVSPKRETPEFALKSVILSGEPGDFLHLVNSWDYFEKMLAENPREYFDLALSTKSLRLPQAILERWFPGYSLYHRDPERSMLNKNEISNYLDRVFCEGSPSISQMEEIFRSIDTEDLCDSGSAIDPSDFMEDFPTACCVLRFWGKYAVEPFLYCLPELIKGDDYGGKVPDVDEAMRENIDLSRYFADPTLREKFRLTELLLAYPSSGWARLFLALGVDPTIDINGYPLGYYFLVSPRSGDSLNLDNPELLRDHSFMEAISAGARDDFVPQYISFRVCNGFPLYTLSKDRDSDTSFFNQREAGLFDYFAGVFKDFSFRSFQPPERKSLRRFIEVVTRKYDHDHQPAEMMEASLDLINTLRLTKFPCVSPISEDSPQILDALRPWVQGLEAMHEAVKHKDFDAIISRLSGVDHNTQVRTFVWALRGDCPLPILERMVVECSEALQGYFKKDFLVESFPQHKGEVIQWLYRDTLFAEENVLNRFLRVVTPDIFESIARNNSYYIDPHKIHQDTLGILYENAVRGQSEHALERLLGFAVESKDWTWAKNYPDFLEQKWPLSISGTRIGIFCGMMGLLANNIGAEEILRKSFQILSGQDTNHKKLCAQITNFRYWCQEAYKTAETVLCSINSDEFKPIFDDACRYDHLRHEDINKWRDEPSLEYEPVDWGAGERPDKELHDLNITLLMLQTGANEEEALETIRTRKEQEASKVIRRWVSRYLRQARMPSVS
ncbi:MAG: hypothetical protein H6849_01815 [Alphaproteobacteria bacterium]|nr:MAG: hypothetical protein H6849_01815 [Alphaproteobacteria bacterium]